MKVFRGVTQKQETQQAYSMRDVRPLLYRVGDALLDRRVSAATLVAMVFFMLFLPAFVEIFFIIVIFVFWYGFWVRVKLPFKLPLYADMLDLNDPKPGGNAPGKSSGLYFFGNDAVTREELWFSNIDMRTHTLIFGSTGSGKTQALLSIAYNALVQGSGFIYVDGKADNQLYAQIFALARMLGREDDLLVVNFMTGAQDIIGPQEHILSNSLNPFASGSSSMLSQLVISMMDGSGGATPGSSDSDMWKGRAIAFIEALMRTLVYLRDQGETLLDAGIIRRYFTLDALEGLMFDGKILDERGNEKALEGKIPFEVLDPLWNYLATLPGFQKSNKGKQSSKAFEQHGYIVMQLTRVFGSLADVYGHIIRTHLADVDFKDVVLNRRILVVLLPAMEKSPDELSNLGKLIIASLKAMLAAGLGEQVEGDYKDVIETKPTNANTPYLCVLDEYGYYAVKGFAVVPAQARSLGFSVVFAGQDLPAFQKVSKEEAASIYANTNIKICMKLEDPVETWEFFQKTAGEAYVSVVKGFNQSAYSSTTSTYRDTLEASLDKRFRVDLLDLKDQREGEAHIFFKSRIVRAQLFYADPPPVAEVRMNHFLKVNKPTDDAVHRLKAISNTLTLKEIEVSEDQDIEEFKKIYNTPDLESAHACFDAVIHYLDGRNEEHDIGTTDFSEVDTDFSIFMEIPLEDRITSDLFDFEVASLDDTLVSKEKIYQVIERFYIMGGRGKTEIKKMSQHFMHDLAERTSYTLKVPLNAERMCQSIDALMSTIKAS